MYRMCEKQWYCIAHVFIMRVSALAETLSGAVCSISISAGDGVRRRRKKVLGNDMRIG